MKESKNFDKPEKYWKFNSHLVSKGVPTGTRRKLPGAAYFVLVNTQVQPGGYRARDSGNLMLNNSQNNRKKTLRSSSKRVTTFRKRAFSWSTRKSFRNEK